MHTNVPMVHCSICVCFVIKNLSCLKTIVCMSEKKIQNILQSIFSIKIKQPILKLLTSVVVVTQKLAFLFLKSCKLSFWIKLNRFFFYLFWFSNKNMTGLFSRILINWGLAKIDYKSMILDIIKCEKHETNRNFVFIKKSY